jgi:hypothetical protein
MVSIIKPKNPCCGAKYTGECGVFLLDPREL